MLDKMNPKKFFSIFLSYTKVCELKFPLEIFLILLVSSNLTWAISISCDCSENSCQCVSDCSSGFLDIYKKGCQGPPSYELSFSQGKTTWLPPQEGKYYLKVLCDNSEKSGCKSVEVSPPVRRKAPSTEFLPYLFLLAMIVMASLLIYVKYQKKKEMKDVKKKVKE